jgi:uncharacterized protein with HEPN domain
VTSNHERLLHIREAIERVSRYTSQGRAAFDADELIQTWVVHHLEIIGEATRSLPEELRARYPAVPWRQIIRMRNVLIHAYFGIDLEWVWSVVEDDLPPLRREIEQALINERSHLNWRGTVAAPVETLPIGLIGCGNMGSSHARQMGALAELRLAATCDVDERWIAVDAVRDLSER